jgi:hypothetical protein
MADIICERIAKGESLRKICLDDNMPAHSTILKWLRDIDGFSSQYARAREDQAEFYLDEIIAISDESSQDKIANEDGTERTDSEAIQRSKLRVDTRKWAMAKLAPKKYGDKITQEVTGANGDPISLLLTQVQGNSLGVSQSTADDDED